QEQRRPAAQRPLAAAPAAHLQPLHGIQAPQPLVIDPHALALEQHMQTPVAEPAASPRQLLQPRPQGGRVGTTLPVAHRRPVGFDHTARPPLAHLMHLAQMRHGFPPGSGRHHFFEATSFSMALSSIASASSFFSLAFSSSSAFSRRASDTSRPPYLAFHL